MSNYALERSVKGWIQRAAGARTLERMTRHIGLLLVLAFAVLASCSDSRDEGRSADLDADTLAADDRAVLEVALADFGAWKEATFGIQDGVLALGARSTNLIDQTLPDTRQLIEPITDVVSDELIVAFLKRNAVQGDVTSLVASSQWARIYPPVDDSEFWPIPPDGAKAVGSIALPGFNANRTHALVQINHSWSIHGTIVTYVLSRQDGAWTIQAKDQQVFL